MSLNRNTEVIQLALADRRVAAAERAFSNQLLDVERMLFDGHDSEAAEKLLAKFRVALQDAKQERQNIVKKIEDIDACKTVPAAG